MSLGKGAAIPNGSSLIAVYGRKGTHLVVGVGLEGHSEVNKLL